MKHLKNYMMLFLITFITAFSACESDVGGTKADDISDGLSSNYLLKSLSVNAPSLYNEDDPNATILQLDYDFVPTVWEYSIEVPFSIDIITVTAEKEHIWADMFLDETLPSRKLSDRNPSGPIQLQVGQNPVKIIVVAQNGESLEYLINVTRHTAENAVALLSDLAIDGVTLSPEFDPSSSGREFSASINADTIKLSAIAQCMPDGATVEFIANDDEVSDPDAIPLNGGMNVIRIICTAGDGITKETYSLNIFRQQVTNTADLVALSINGASFNEPFDKNTTSYTVNVSASMNPLTLVVQAESSSAEVDVEANGTAVTDLTAITVNNGPNDITITVTNGTVIKTYSITATCTAASTNANLKSLKVGVGTISTRPIHPGTFMRDATYHDPASVRFSKTGYDYVTVIYGFSSITVTAAVDDSAAKNVQFTATSHAGGNAVSSQNFTGGAATAVITLDAGYVTRIDITVTSGADTTQVYHLYAKLLNGDEFYWGIYAPSMDKSKSTWKKPQPGHFDRKGYVSGTVNWDVTSEPVSTIALENYNDGKLDFLYNDGGIIINGTHEAELESITVKDGWDLTKNPPFMIRTAPGEDVAELDYHLWIDNSDPTERSDSYTRIKYLGLDWHTQYYRTSKPYPFSSTYDWFTPWSDGQ